MSSIPPTVPGLLDDVLIVATKTEEFAEVDEALGEFLALVEEGGGLRPEATASGSTNGHPRPGSPGAHIRDHVLTTFHHLPTTFFSTFCDRRFAFIVFQSPEISANKPQRAPEKPEPHHNSPQTPNTCLVRPPLLTLVRPGYPNGAEGDRLKRTGEASAKQKSPVLERMGL